MMVVRREQRLGNLEKPHFLWRSYFTTHLDYHAGCGAGAGLVMVVARGRSKCLGIECYGALAIFSGSGTGYRLGGLAP